MQHIFQWDLSSLSLGWPDNVPGSCLHLYSLERVALSSSSISQDVPCTPVDTVSHPTVAPTVILSIQVSCQAGIKPPACTVVLTTVSSCVTVIVSVWSAEGSAIMVVAFAVAQGISCIARVLPSCQTIPGRQRENICEDYKCGLYGKGWVNSVLYSFNPPGKLTKHNSINRGSYRGVNGSDQRKKHLQDPRGVCF